MISRDSSIDQSSSINNTHLNRNNIDIEIDYRSMDGVVTAFDVDILLFVSILSLTFINLTQDSQSQYVLLF